MSLPCIPNLKCYDKLFPPFLGSRGYHRICSMASPWFCKWTVHGFSKSWKNYVGGVQSWCLGLSTLKIFSWLVFKKMHKVKSSVLELLYAWSIEKLLIVVQVLKVSNKMKIANSLIFQSNTIEKFFISNFLWSITPLFEHILLHMHYKMCSKSGVMDH